jgi:hypothetical protein
MDCRSRHGKFIVALLRIIYRRSGSRFSGSPSKNWRRLTALRAALFCDRLVAWRDSLGSGEFIHAEITRSNR